VGMSISPDMLPTLTPELQQLIKANELWMNQHATELRQSETLYRTRTIQPLFMPPLRAVNLLDVTPTTTPSVRGPSS